MRKEAIDRIMLMAKKDPQRAIPFWLWGAYGDPTYKLLPRWDEQRRWTDIEVCPFTPVPLDWYKETIDLLTDSQVLDLYEQVCFWHDR